MVKKSRSLEEIKSLGKEMFLFDSFEDYDEADILEVLKTSADLYHNDQEPFLSDEQYDALHRYAELSFGPSPTLEAVGAEVRGGKIKLPYPMGSLTQAYQGDTVKWIAEHNLQNEDIVITEKLDGISCLLVYGDDGKLRIAYSRGDGVEGADITRHVSKIKAVPKKVMGASVIRGEIIFSKKKWNAVKTVIKRSGGDFYKNARNATAGLMNASVSDPVAYDNLDVVAYEAISIALTTRQQAVPTNKETILELLTDFGFTTPVTHIVKGSLITDEYLTEEVNSMRKHSEYEIDGVVLEVSDKELRSKINPSRDTLNPEYARKYKVADVSNYAETEVVEVQWNISKSGYLKPRVIVKPVDLPGITWTYATGYNARWIVQNKVGPGTIVGGQRMGDVVPNIIRIVKASEAQMPALPWKWNETEVDAVLTSMDGNVEVAIQQTLDFFTSIDAPNLGEGSIRDMFSYAMYTDAATAISKMLNYSRDTWILVIGANGEKIYNGLRDKLSAIPLHVFLGSTHFFGRGVGVRKWKKLLAGLNIKDVAGLEQLHAAWIVTVEGFDEKTAKKIVHGLEPFLEFYKTVETLTHFLEVIIPSGGILAGKGFVFTGFRSKELEAEIEKQGGVMMTTVSKKTSYLVAADPTENSGKLKKARDVGVKVIGEAELRSMLGE